MDGALSCDSIEPLLGSKVGKPLPSPPDHVSLRGLHQGRK